MKGYVYFIKQENEDLFKIGITYKDPNARLRSMQTGTPHKLEMFGLVSSDNPRRLEKELHKQFKDYHIRGEWFRLTQEQVKNYLEGNRSTVPNDIIEVKQGSKLFYYQKSTKKIFIDTRTVAKLFGDFYLMSCFASGREMLGFYAGGLGVNYDYVIEDFNKNKDELLGHKNKLIQAALEFNEP